MRVLRNKGCFDCVVERFGRDHFAQDYISPLVIWNAVGETIELILFVGFRIKTAQIVGLMAAFGWTLALVSMCAGQSSAPLGRVHGTVVDPSGAVVTGARVTLTRADQSAAQEAVSAGDGQFIFVNVPPGAFRLRIQAVGFATQTFSGELQAGENQAVPLTALTVAENVTEVQVGVSQVEVAEEQLKVEEKQRVLGAVPNFYVSYNPDAVSLTAKQKFKLAGKTVIDPVTFLMVGGAAGVQQAQNHFEGYGQGAQGYAKRFGAGYADTVAGTFVGSAILPSILKQDPRYFYKGTGSVRSRFLYAIANAFICKGDNGRWQPSYSSVLGSVAAGAISNIYYPAQDRDGVDLTFENAAIGVGTGALTNVLQEFLIKKLTPKTPKMDATKP